MLVINLKNYPITPEISLEDGTVTTVFIQPKGRIETGANRPVTEDWYARNKKDVRIPEFEPTSTTKNIFKTEE